MKKEDIRRQLTRLQGWSCDGEKLLGKTYVFSDFDEAVRFLGEVARCAKEQNHHPDLRITYNVLAIELTTHDAGGVSDKDFLLAAKIDEIRA